MIPKTRVLIVDDHAMVRLALAEALAQQDDLELVGEAENGARAIALYRELQPDVVTMDYQMPGLNGAEAISEILAEFPEARIVLLSIYETPESLWRATEAGALGCVSKGVEVDEIITAVRAVASGVSYYSEGLEKKLDERRAQEALSPRETEILAQIVSGHSNKEIVANLGISTSTVKHHIERVFTKLGVNDRTQAATAAVKRGIIQLD
ncbi:response regulator transcription factor [Akkermansiaceae bacterium]|nr:response regulator transcription factor [Akkermansiaceae bacterium]MDB4745126.1 response regulator transcription factor [bacterium]MDB2428736.1 response regulator transcription factor [Akkermansiaceae bacterium]MDB4576641.1 response regulator transcription factor [Akkermansiaceae bacterium]MDB4734137.1 response regulator transcription factor [Akkermansiaceae bacterium]